ncbi:hypothetical protein RRG08_061062 [Elysia crispata]|uniref:Uncharacterized protein n=1 Tax=Elysia crispata TaxID=231223 RepID=A0AAE1AV90_9GAST|nr:hypothetical protein RRG08_061062 [Elysia crispata]
MRTSSAHPVACSPAHSAWMRVTSAQVTSGTRVLAEATIAVCRQTQPLWLVVLCDGHRAPHRAASTDAQLGGQKPRAAGGDGPRPARRGEDNDPECSGGHLVSGWIACPACPTTLGPLTRAKWRSGGQTMITQWCIIMLSGVEISQHYFNQPLSAIDTTNTKQSMFYLLGPLTIDSIVPGSRLGEQTRQCFDVWMVKSRKQASVTPDWWRPEKDHSAGRVTDEALTRSAQRLKFTQTS